MAGLPGYDRPPISPFYPGQPLIPVQQPKPPSSPSNGFSSASQGYSGAGTTNPSTQYAPSQSAPSQAPVVAPQNNPIEQAAIDKGIIKPPSLPIPAAQPKPATAPIGFSYSVPPKVTGGTLVPIQSEQVKEFGYAQIGTETVQFQAPQKYYDEQTGTSKMVSQITYPVYRFGSSGFDPYRFNTASGNRELLTELIVPQSAPTQLFSNLPVKIQPSESGIPFVSSAAQIILGLKAGEKPVSPYSSVTGTEVAKAGFAGMAVESASMILPELGVAAASKVASRIGAKASEPVVETFTKLLTGQSESGDYLSIGVSKVKVGEKTFDYPVGAVTKRLSEDVTYTVNKEFTLPKPSVPDIGFVGKVETVPKGTMLSDIKIFGKETVSAKGAYTPTQEVTSPIVDLTGQKIFGNEGIILSGKTVERGTGNVILETSKPTYSKFGSISAKDVSSISFDKDIAIAKQLDDTFSFVESRALNVNAKGRISLSSETALGKMIDRRSSDVIQFTRPTGARTDVLEELGKNQFFKELGVSKFQGQEIELVWNRPPSYFGDVLGALKAESGAAKKEIESMVSSAATQTARREYTLLSDYTGFKSTASYVVTPMLKSSIAVSGFERAEGVSYGGGTQAQKLSSAFMKNANHLEDFMGSTSDLNKGVEVDLSSLSRFDNRVNPMFAVTNRQTNQRTISITSPVTIPSSRTEKGFDIIPAIGQFQGQRQLTKQITSNITRQINSEMVPFKMPTLSAPSFPPVIGPLSVGGGGYGLRKGFRTKQSRRYSPSLIGILSGKTTSRIPKNLTGIEIRLPYKRR